MALRNTTALLLLTDGTDMAPSLPDPATTSGRVHWLVNASSGLTTWSSSGLVDPFTENAMNIASVGVAAGQVKYLRSNGTRWTILLTLGSRRVFSDSGVTDGAGNVTFTFTPPFPTVPVITNVLQTALADATEARVTALSTSSVTFNVRRSPAVVILGISVLSASVPAAGVTVHCDATEAGQGV
jgi:hypothetical protein